jgi:hypothetical protein
MFSLIMVFVGFYLLLNDHPVIGVILIFGAILK